MKKSRREIEAHRRKSRGWSRWAFPLAAVCLAFAALGAIECLLRLVGLGAPSSYRDPFVGFSRLHPLFEREATGQAYETARAHRNHFGVQQFSAEKSPDSFRVFCLGGSTVLGNPFHPPTAFPQWLALELEGLDPARRFEVINCGGTSYASYRLAPILDEVLDYKPNLIILTTGHNEFLEDRTYGSIKRRSAVQAWFEDQLYSLHSVTLLRQGVESIRGGEPLADGKTLLKPEVDARLDYGSGYASYQRDKEWWQGVAEHFRHNLNVMVEMCRESNVPLLMVNPGANLRDCPPYKSQHRSGLDSQDLARWTSLFEEGSRVESQDIARALRAYRQAQAIDGEYAQLVYRIARCLDRLGRYDEARATYIAAKDLDVCPLRIPESIQTIVFDVARQTQTPLIDARRILRERSPERIPGFNAYLDHLHPTIRGHQLIAHALTDQMVGMKLIGRADTWNHRARRKSYRDHLMGLADLYFAKGRKRVEYLDHWARRDRLRGDLTPADARGYLDLARAHLDFREHSEARVAYLQALKLKPRLAPRLLDVALELFQEGRTASATDLARLALEYGTSEDEKRHATLALAILALEAGALEEARTLYRQTGLQFRESDAHSHPWLFEASSALEKLQHSGS